MINATILTKLIVVIINLRLCKSQVDYRIVDIVSIYRCIFLCDDIFLHDIIAGASINIDIFS